MDAKNNETVEKDTTSVSDSSVDNVKQLPAVLPTPLVGRKPTTNVAGMATEVSISATAAVQDVRKNEIEMKKLAPAAPPTQPTSTQQQLQGQKSHGVIEHSPIAPRKSGYQPMLQGRDLNHPPTGATLGQPAKLPVTTPVRRLAPQSEDQVATKKLDPMQIDHPNPEETAAVKCILPDPPVKENPEPPAESNEKLPAKLKEPPNPAQDKEDTEKISSISKKNKIVIQKVECPHPKDVLFPTSGFQLWAGNVHFHRAIDTQRDMFLAASPKDRPQIASGIKKRILKEGGRFLRAIEIAPLDKNGEKNPMVICRTNWREMDDTTSVELVVKALSSDTQAREDSRKRRDERMAKRRKERRLAQEAAMAAEEAVENEVLPGGRPSGPLEVLYYVPPGRHGVSHAKRKAGAFPGVRPKGSSKASKLMEPPKTIDYSSSSSTSSDSDSTLESSPPKATATKKRPKGGKRGPKAAPKKQAKITGALGGAAAGANDSVVVGGSSNVALPKGVTVRPSGKWQAQTYFAGQSRYVGVFDTSEMAAAAYNVVQAFIRNYKRNNDVKATGDSSKESLAMVFAAARLQADRAVKELQEKKKQELKLAELSSTFNS